MDINKLVRLPWKLKDWLRVMRQELAESRRATAELMQMVLALEKRQQEITERLFSEARTEGMEKDRRWQQEISSLSEMLVGEIREQGIMMETAASALPRALADRKLRGRLTPPLSREPGVSILITCWNHAAVLANAVRSAVATLEALPVPAEVLILDDGSRDGSREVAQELAREDARIRLIASDENLGLPRARNLLLSQARFEHAMILDSDNELVPSGVARLYASARQTNAVLTYGNIVQVDQSGSITGVISNERVTASLLNGNWIDAMALLRTDRVLELGGYDPQWAFGLEDWELNQRLFSLCEPLVFVPVLTGKYMISPLSMLRAASLSSRVRRGLRVFGRGDAADSVRFRACIHHPAVGTLFPSAGWSKPEPSPPARPVLQTRPAPLKLLVVSSGGVQNCGDDAILISTLQRLQRIRPDSLATVVSDGPSCPPLGRLGLWAGTCEEFASSLKLEDVRKGCRGDRALEGALSTCLKFGSRSHAELSSFDVVLFAGGGNLNTHWPELIARRAAIAAAAIAAGVPYVLSGQGVGPVTAENIPMISFLVGGAAAVATRDPLSLRLLNRIVRSGPRISMVGDDALGFRCDEPAVARGRLAQIGVPLDQPLLGFQAREACYVGFSRDELNETARAVDDFAAESGHAVVCVPTNTQPHAPEVGLLADLATCTRRRASWHIVNPGDDVAAIAGVIKVCNAFLAHSYHAAIFALENQIPTLLFVRSEYYQQKAEALRTAFGIPVSLVAPPDLADGAIARQLESISQASWSKGMTSADVDLWLDLALPRHAGEGRKPSIAGFDLAALGKLAG